MAFGAQRLVSPLDWSNTRRTFDGASAIVSLGSWQATGFWTRPVQVNRYAVNDWGPKDSSFYGLYATGLRRGQGDPQRSLLARPRAATTRPGTAPPATRSARRSARASPACCRERPLDFDVEGAYQLGEVGPRRRERLHGGVADRLVARDAPDSRRASSSASTGRAATRTRAATSRPSTSSSRSRTSITAGSTRSGGRTRSTPRSASCCTRSRP